MQCRGAIVAAVMTVVVSMPTGAALAQSAASPDLKTSIEALAQKLETLTGAERSAARKDAAVMQALQKLSAQIAAATYENDATLLDGNIKELTAAISKARLNDAEREEFAKSADVKSLAEALGKLAGYIRIVKATYGDHRTGRICDATAFFRAHCLNKTQCPTDTEVGSNGILAGMTLCGYEPAPLADPPANVRVTYSCGTLKQPPLSLRGKGRIVCAP